MKSLLEPLFWLSDVIRCKQTQKQKGDLIGLSLVFIKVAKGDRAARVMRTEGLGGSRTWSDSTSKRYVCTRTKFIELT
jgi:hypothetical protein